MTIKALNLETLKLLKAKYVLKYHFESSIVELKKHPDLQIVF